MMPLKATGQVVRIGSETTRISLRAHRDRLEIVGLGRGQGSPNLLGRATKIEFPAGAGLYDVVLHPRWQLSSVKVSSSQRAVFTYQSFDKRFSVASEWDAASGAGPIEHRLSFINRSHQSVEIPATDSMAFDVAINQNHRYRNWWVEKPAGRATAHGTHHDAIGPSYSALVSSTPYSEDQRRDAIPWTTVQDETAESGWYAGIEFSGIVRLALHREGSNLQIRAGLDPKPDAGRPTSFLVLPGETWHFPVVFVGCFKGSVDDGANQLHRWVDDAIKPKSPERRLPLATINTWGLGMSINEEKALRFVDLAKSLGFDMFHMDAGWFASVGDWRPNLAKFPNGLKPISDRVHDEGLKYGLWVGWTQAGNGPEQGHEDTTLSAFDPKRRDWLAVPPAPNWKPQDFTGTDLCLADGDAQHWCEQLLDSLADDLHLDMLEHDQRMIVSKCVQTDHDHTISSGDVAYRAALGYYSVYDHVRAKHPDLLFENCVNGGRMIDYGAMKRAHYISICDTYTPLENRQAFYDASFAVPPAMCECYVSWIPTKTDEEFVTMLRSGMMGWFTLMQDPSDWHGRQYELAHREIARYKSKLRPLIQSGNLYHVTDRPSDMRWDAMEYVSADGKRSALMAFKGAQAEGDGQIILKGLLSARKYRITFAGNAGRIESARGSDLMRTGVRVQASPSGSEVVLLEMLSH